MSRITGSEVRSMMEAYNDVYAPQITEQQIQEDFENWVYSLVDEGEDLSGYTWDEMYEAYVTEAIPLAIPAAMAAAPYVLPALGAAAYTAKELMNRGKTKNTPEQERFLSTGSFQSRKNKPGTGQPPTGQTTRVSSPAAKPKPETPKPPTGQKPRVTINNTGSPSSSGGAGGGGGGGNRGGGGGNQPPNPPKGPNPLQQAVTKVADTAYQGAKPILKSATSITGKIAAGTGVAAAGDELATRGAGRTLVGKTLEYTRQAGPALRGEKPAAAADPAPTKPKYKYENYSVDFDNNQYINEKKVLAKKGNTWVSVETDPSGNKTETELKSNEINPEAIKRYNSLATQKAKQQATQATNQRTSLGVVAGGKSGYTVSTSDKPKAGETTQQWQSRRSEGLKLADTLNKDSGLGKYRTTTPAPGTTPPRITPAPGTTPPRTTPAPGTTLPARPSVAPAATKPAIERSPQGYAVGTTAGGTKFERRAATGAELAAARDARQKALASAPTDKKGAEEAAVKAGVQRSQPTTGSASATVKPASGTFTSRDMSKYPLKPVTSTQATAAASSTSPAASGSVAPITKTIASAPKPTPVAPKAAPVYSSKEGDGKPLAPGLELWSYQYEDAYDLVLEYLLNNGHVDTLDEALYVMMEMDVETIGTIVEGGFNSSGRYDVGGGRTVGPVAGAIRSLVTGNLPKQKKYIPPSPRQGTNTSPAVPTSKDDSGKSTDFGAGGGKAKMKTGMTVGQVERQGRMNKGDYSG
jgi:hypothetical protein